MELVFEADGQAMQGSYCTAIVFLLVLVEPSCALQPQIEEYFVQTVALFFFFVLPKKSQQYMAPCKATKVPVFSKRKKENKSPRARHQRKRLTI